MIILIGSLWKLNVELVWLVYGHVATWSESISAGEGWAHAWGEGVGGVGVWRMDGRRRKEKDLVLG